MKKEGTRCPLFLVRSGGCFVDCNVYTLYSHRDEEKLGIITRNKESRFIGTGISTTTILTIRVCHGAKRHKEKHFYYQLTKKRRATSFLISCFFVVSRRIVRLITSMITRAYLFSYLRRKNFLVQKNLRKN